MRYPVPQFIDIEYKIIGPITVRQFVILIFAITVGFFFFKYADMSLFIFVSIILAMLVIVLGFVNVNGRGFHYFLLNMIEMLFKSAHLMVWTKEVPKTIPKAEKNKKKKDHEEQINYVAIAAKKQKAHSRISELSLLVDTGGYYKKE